MSVKELVTPYFLDEFRPALADEMPVDAVMNSVAPTAGPIQTAIAPIHRDIADFTRDCRLQGLVPASLAGDCCASIPVLAGLQQAGLDPLLVWLDAHGDFNTWETSPSGFLGGMPLAMIAGRGEMSLMEEVGAKPLHEDRIYLSDARDLDPEEAKALKGSAIHILGDLDELLDRIPGGEQVYIHFDSDVISSDEVPAQSYPVAGGPSSAEVERFFGGVAEKSEIVGASMSAWNPSLDADGSSGRIVRACFGSLLRRIG